MPIKILDVGQCGFDGPRMSRLLQEKLDATVDGAATEEDAIRRLSDGKYDLVLVNRILAVDGASGVELIHTLIKSGCTTPLMLVSDHTDAQDIAVTHGAVRGFGKAVLEKPETFELIRNAVHPAPHERLSGPQGERTRDVDDE
jgi:DNA-binding NarL/FixJ family response regulator